jgi:hypothetical protein
MSRVELRVDPAFVEEAVFLALRTRQASGDGRIAQPFFTAREALYEIAVDPEEREHRFQALAWNSFRALGLEAAFADRLSELPLVAAHVRTAIVRRAWTRKEEDVDLYRQPEALQRIGATDGVTLLIAVQPSRCCDEAALVAWLRRGLLRISDMVDPAFAYQQSPAMGGSSLAEDEVIRSRFRALWDAFVEARMRRNGWSQDSGERMEPPQEPTGWDLLQQRSQWTQRELLELAREPQRVRLAALG